MDLSVIVPLHNEERQLSRLEAELVPHLDREVGRGSWQFVLVENGSRDRTQAVARELVERLPGSRLLALESPDYGRALRAGLAEASGQYAYIINADFYDPTFLAWGFRARADYDVLVGSKRADPTLDERSRYRKLLSWGLTSILQVVFGFVGSDTHGQKMLRLAALRPLLELCVMDRGLFDTEFMIRAQRARLMIYEIPVPIREVRRQRNPMLRKILLNLYDIARLKRVARGIPFRGLVRYRFLSRSIVLEELGDSERGGAPAA